MALPIFTIVGATGAQGSSVVSAFSCGANPAYHIRALTSDSSTPAAACLASLKHVSIVQADLNSVDELKVAFDQSTVIFANTFFPPQTFMSTGARAAQKQEENQGLNIAVAASQIKSLRHFIWSTLPDALSISNGVYEIPHFQSKLLAERFIRDKANNLLDKTTFLRVGLYGSNLGMDPYRPMLVNAARKLILMLPCSSDAQIPFIGDETSNVGLIVKSIVEHPNKTIGRYVLGASEVMSCRDWATKLAQALQRKGIEVDVVFSECTLEVFEDLWGHVGTEIGLMFEYYKAYGYRGYVAETGPLPILTLEDLGLNPVALQSTVDRLSGMTWPTF